VVVAQTIKICPECTVNNLEDALSQSEDGDTILIASSIYKVDNIVIDKSIYLKGEGKPTLYSAEGNEILTILADNVTIEGLRFEGVTTSYLKERSGIRIKEAKNFNILNNEVIDCFFGIYLEHSKRGKIQDNTISGNATTEAESGNGIHAWYSDNIDIVGNLVVGHRDGIYFEFVNKSNVVNNRSEKNKRYGLHFMFSNDDSYRQNTFKNNGVGVAVMFSRRIKMIENKFSYNWGRSSYGLLLKEIYDADITDNMFEQNTVGIFVEGSNRIIYQHNTFKRNGWAIKFSGGCEDNEIIYNNFLDNSLDLVVNTKLASNRFHHNYWSNYAGYDLDKDNIGDIPHFPVKLFSYVLEQAPEAIVLMRSLFVEIINYAEKVSPVFTPKEVKDDFPLMTIYNADN
jgi:nitrous oxidase accessory protein